MTANILRSSIQLEGTSLERLTTYYLDRNWQYFDKCLNSILPGEGQAFSLEWKKDDIIHRLYDSFFIPVLSLDEHQYYPHMKIAFNEVWMPDRANFSRMVEFAKSETATDQFKNVQRDLFEHLSRFISFITALLPGLVCDLVPSVDQPKVDQLRLFRDDYEKLRDFYIQSFETCHKSLRWVIGAANADTNGDSNRFVVPAGISSTLSNDLAGCLPRNLDAFSKLVSANKRKWLVVLPGWDSRWDQLFDRHLRNDLGHASARHDLPTGLIQRDGRQSLPYIRFVQQTQRILHAIISCANAMKILRVYALMLP